MIPDGFKEIPPRGGNLFLAHCAGMWGKFDQGKAVIGFRVEAVHCNAEGVCHGGMLMTFADTFLPLVTRLQEGTEDGFTPTVSMTTDFLGVVKAGVWIEGRGGLVRRTGRLLFLEGHAFVEDQPVLRVSGIFKRGTAGQGAARLGELLALLRAP